MWEGCYGKEPFDLRLTVLRLLRNSGKIILLTIIGTLLFGGGYYVKNVLLGSETQYSATSTYKVDYEVPPVNSNDYYINEMTWNTLVQSGEFLEAVHFRLLADSSAIVGSGELNPDTLRSMISAKLPSDWAIPTVTVVTSNKALTEKITRAVELVMQAELVDYLEEVKSIRVMTAAAEAEEVKPDVRPTRAFVLSGILSFFFVSVVFLLKELGDDSIWLPATLRSRYGLPVVGTINSPEFLENVEYLFAGKEKVAVCLGNSDGDVSEVTGQIAEKIAWDRATKEREASQQWIAVPSPVMCPESCKVFREMDGILLVAEAGSHAGKPLEYTLELLKQQNCDITAVVLWDADETLISVYYCFETLKRIFTRK